MFIQTEPTPNPATLKFLPGRDVMGALDPRDFRTPEEAQRSPLAHHLFTIEGVKAVFLGRDFITVTKDIGDWQHLKPAILGAIMDFFLKGMPVVAETDPTAQDNNEEFFEPADSETVATIKDLIETRVRPAVAQDGGDITFRGFKDGVVYLNMRGACAGCPSSTATLRNGIQNLLRHFLPDVTEVRAV